MTNGSVPPSSSSEDDSLRTVLIIVGIVLVLVGVGLIVGAVLLAINAETTAGTIEVVRDMLIVAMAFELIVVGVAFVVLLIQIARFVNLLTNEIQPLIDTTADTINVVKGTAVFLSKNLTEPVINALGTVGGIRNVVGDADAIRKAAGIIGQAIVSAAITGARGETSPPVDTDDDAQPENKPTAETANTSNKSTDSSQSKIDDNF